MAGKRDYYEILGVARTATSRDISVAYRKLAIKYHPDSNPGDETATALFKEAAEAFEVLNDSDKRARYDRHGHSGLEGSQQQFTDLEDILDAFGGMFGGIFGGGGGGGRRRRPRRGQDIGCEVTLTLEEAYQGVTRTVEFNRNKACQACSSTGVRPGSVAESCRRCGGQGQVVQAQSFIRVQTTCPDCQGSGEIITDPCLDCRGRRFVASPVVMDVAIPAGIDDEMRVCVPGEGEPSAGGGTPGDFFCFVRVREHPIFERDGKHLILKLPLTYTQAVLGASIEVPTMEGPHELAVPAGTQHGKVFRLRTKGMPDPHGGSSGDLLIQTLLEVPQKVSPEQEKLLRELAELEQTQVTPHRKSFLEKLKDHFAPADEVDG